MPDAHSAPDRRRFLLFTAGAAACLVPGLASAKLTEGPARELSFYNLHTGETLTAAYWDGGRYQEDALAEINHILRDHRTGEVYSMERKLLDLLNDLRLALDTDAPFEVISGYRSPKTNATLASASNGVAKRSLHMRGMAIDIRMPGIELSTLRDTAIAMKRGGVGYYAKSGFIHVDVGRFRTW